MSYFNDIYRYFDKRPSLHCIPVKGKSPYFNDWSEIEITSDVIENWENHDSSATCTGFGLRAGQHNIGWMDVDTDDIEHLYRIDEIMDISNICAKKGRVGKTVFFRFIGTPKKSKYNIYLVSGTKKPIVEFNFTSGQTVLPPSIHPETALPYTWISQSLLDIDIEDLPIIDEDKIEHLESILRASSLQEGLKNVPTGVTGTGSGKFLTIQSEATRLLHLGVDESTISKTLIGMDRRLFTGNQFFLSKKLGKDNVSDNDIENAACWLTTYKQSLMRSDPALRATMMSVIKVSDVAPVYSDWEIPSPLLTKKQALEFPGGLFPDAFESYCHDLSLQTTLPPEAYLTALFTTFSAASQAKVIIHAMSNFKLHPSVSTMIVAPSGSRKDAIFDASYAPLKRLIRIQKSKITPDFIQNEKNLIGKLEDLDKKRKQAINKQEDIVLKEVSKEIVELQKELTNIKKQSPNFIFESGTQEKLFQLMHNNYERGIFIRSSEYTQMTGVLGAANNPQLQAFYLKMFNGSTTEEFSHQTIGGVNVDLEKVVGCALVGAQTDMLAKDLRKLERGENATGFLQRFFLVSITSDIKRMVDSDRPIDSSRIDNLFALFFNHPGIVDVTWEDKEAKDAYLDYDLMLRERNQHEKSALRSFRDKYSGQSVKLGWIYSQGNMLPGRISTKIDKQSFLKAVSFLEWQSRNLDVVWNSMNYNMALRSAELMVAAIQTKSIKESNFSQDVQRATKLDTMGLKAGMEMLFDNGYIRYDGNKIIMNPYIK